MEFTESHPIYVQISELIKESILTERYRPGEKIPSVREMAVLTETNPNTVMRSYSLLQESAMIYQKRGLGYFVADDAQTLIRREKRNDFVEREVPRLFRLMELLDLPFEELRALHEEFHGLKEENQ
ncbi:GntR family transcriptional regulator [Myxococcota bacterium]|nr:GntR family transcriptional regulator [Myxococcota bacterium]MBU1534030.1 GntR family transcriptional regulator [Myxococcota bacterium]